MTKKYLLGAILSILFTISSAHAGSWNGWIYQNPYPTANILLAVKFITPQKGWIAGEKGTILYTEDGGDTWEYQESGTEQDIKSLAFVNEKTGWAVGNGGTIIYTEDGGKTWVMQVTHTEASLNKVFFLDEKEGWVVGNEWGDTGLKGMLFHTSDSGNKWEIQDIGIKRGIANIFFINHQTGWILAGDDIYRTRDGGKKWEKNKIAVQIPQGGKIGEQVGYGSSEIPADWMQGDIFFVNDKTGWVVVGMWFILHTEDGGKTWKKQLDTGFMSYGLGRLFFTDDKKGCAAGSTIFCTEDGGKTWKERLGVAPGERGHIEGFMVSVWGFSFVNEATGWVVGNEGQIMKTEDGGKSWRVKTTQPMDNIYFQNEKTGWAVRKGIVKTEDGGDTWKVQKEFDAPTNLKFFFINSTIGWAVGWQRDPKVSEYKIRNTIILHTEDGGKTWVTQFNKPGKITFIDASFINSQVGWVVGSNGLILHTRDGGKYWEEQKSGTKFRLNGVFFVDDKHGWITGVRGGILDMFDDDEVIKKEAIILYTDDGGQHWHTQWKKKDIWFSDWNDHLFFISNDNGWIAGETKIKGRHGLILYTRDEGKTWLESEVKNEFPVNPFFVDRDHGWMLLLKPESIETREKLLFITEDGGKTWKKQNIGLHKYPWKPFESLTK